MSIHQILFEKQMSISWWRWRKSLGVIWVHPLGTKNVCPIARLAFASSFSIKTESSLYAELILSQLQLHI